MTTEGETARPGDQTGQHLDVLNPAEPMAADTNHAGTDADAANGPPSKRRKMAASIAPAPPAAVEHHATSTTDISMGEATESLGPANRDTAGPGDPAGPGGNGTGEENAQVAGAFALVDSEKRARVRGVAPIKAEYLITKPESELDNLADGAAQDDAAEGREDNVRTDRDHDNRDSRDNRRNNEANSRHDKKKRERGQNKERHFGRTADIIRLCPTRAFHPEFSPAQCSFGDGCRYGHDLREYLEAGRREDSATATFCGGPCPVFEKFGRCYSGWKCRFVKSHMAEIEREDGRKELVLIDNTIPKSGTTNEDASGGSNQDIVPADDSHEGATSTTGCHMTAPTEAPAPGHKMNDKQGVAEGPARDQDAMSVDGPLEPKAVEATKNSEDSAKNGEDVVKAGEDSTKNSEDTNAPPKDETGRKNRGRDDNKPATELEDLRPDLVNSVPFRVKVELSRRRVDFSQTDEYIKWMVEEAKLSDTFHTRRKNQSMDGIDDLRAAYVDPPALPSEKRRLYFGPETAVLAPLTTQGNIPFRRLCVELGAQLTYSEMAMSVPLLQGAKADWPLLRAHRSEVAPPRFSPASPDLVPAGYDNSRDLKFGAQISASAPWAAIKAADVLNRYCGYLRLIDLNCGCPIDMIFNGGGGSALLNAPAKMERMIRGMNVVSGEIPITAKLRTGVRTGRPIVSTILGKLAFGSREHRERLGAPGCAAVTLHGRSREMRYTRQADWEYIAECAAIVKAYNSQSGRLVDTAAEPDARTQPAAGRLFFLGNGDCFSHEDYYRNIRDTGVDSVMIGRGALVKPWIFEEIDKGQYLDKTSTQRLEYVEKFVRYGLETWGSDEVGVGYTRRFLLEWLSFHHRYVPIGLLEHLPPSLNDRPPAYKGRDDMETLLSSANYRDWIKISEMYLGPAHPGFHFQPKHKSHAYEAEG